MTTAADILCARATPIEPEIERHGINLKRCGSELVGPCPRCGGRDRFAINVRKQAFNCRGCRRGGGAIALVQFLDGCTFADAIKRLSGKWPDKLDKYLNTYAKGTWDDAYERFKNEYGEIIDWTLLASQYLEKEKGV